MHGAHVQHAVLFEVFAPFYQSYEKEQITLDEFCKQLDNKTGIYLKENA